MSNNNPRGRLSGVDSQSGIVCGVHVKMEGALRRLTLNGISIYPLVRRQ